MSIFTRLCITSVYRCDCVPSPPDHFLVDDLYDQLRQHGVLWSLGENRTGCGVVIDCGEEVFPRVSCVCFAVGAREDYMTLSLWEKGVESCVHVLAGG